MNASAAWLARSVVLGSLAIACVATAACAQAPAEGASAPRGELFVADVREAPSELGLSSSVELQPDGHFDWRLATRDLSLSARGEWERDGGMIRFSNPDQVGEPAIELAGSSRDSEVAVRVALDPATARMASVLEVEFELPDDRFIRAPLSGGGIALPSSEPRPTALRLMSESFSIRTQPIPIPPDGDNDFIVRLVPADLGQAFFGSQQTQFDGNGMTIDWRGIALRYDRAPPSS